MLVTLDDAAACDVGGAQVVNGRQLHAGSVTGLWVEKDGRIRRETSSDWQGARPWSVWAEEGD